MAQFYQIHPVNPQKRLIEQVADKIRRGGVVVFPTDSAYAIGCHLGDKAAVDRIRRIRQVDDKHHMTLICRDLSELGTYAKVDDNRCFRLIKSHVPGPYTFLLKATKGVPKRLAHPKRKTIGLRIPDNAIIQAILEELGEPLMSSTLILPGSDDALSDPDEIRDRLDDQVDLIVDGGGCAPNPTTIIDLYSGEPIILRKGLGEVDDVFF
jgi:tRNA threonylcarbamoyl adenosine modification protein (Sua5/YciO/YrdC/YwlC family)